MNEHIEKYYRLQKFIDHANSIRRRLAEMEYYGVYKPTEINHNEGENFKTK